MSDYMNQNADYWIKKLDLQPHPEGGYYKEIFRSGNEIYRESESRKACTSIYYLISDNDFSAFHRLKSDELWYFHKGEPIFIHVINPQGIYQCIELSDSDSGSLQVIIPPDSWFAAEIPGGAGFSLTSCAVAPGFEFSEFEMGDKQLLINEFPEHRELLMKLCRSL
ncbi:cupin domain-containing protein [Pedobacter sp. G11]|uniref:cupin domain-containing protein n=1 Tax=Pedobacter sp. G11 TaxID=2482728 RepID=UPI001AEF7E7F|nr:cupin domain-containing protein [Pedobacter sp. G11]